MQPQEISEDSFSSAALLTSDEMPQGGPDIGDPYISVRSLWKVFGRNPERVMDPQNADKDKSLIQTEFGNVVGLRDVSFEVKKGETFVIMGLSGSGKSTLVRCLLRLIDPTGGEVIIDGEDITKMSDKELVDFRRAKIAMVFQHYGLMPHRCVLDNAAWGLEVQGVEKEERYARTRRSLELVGLSGWEDAYPRQLSGGMQQRVGLARALVVNTDILLMDEPFSGLDPLIRRQMQDELLNLQTELQKTIVFITHDLNEALKLGDHIAIMHDGAVAQIGTPEDIVLRPEDEYVGDFTQDVRLESVLTASKVMVAAQGHRHGPAGAEGRPSHHWRERRRRGLGGGQPGKLQGTADHIQRRARAAGRRQAIRRGLELRGTELPARRPFHQFRCADSHRHVQRLPNSGGGRQQHPGGRGPPQRPGRSPGRNVQGGPGLRGKRRDERSHRRGE